MIWLFLPIGHKDAELYIDEMRYCVDFALANRQVMMYRVMNVISNCLSKYDSVKVDFDNMINIAHNYVIYENHFGKNVWVHRKGATSPKMKYPRFKEHHLILRV